MSVKQVQRRFFDRSRQALVGCRRQDEKDDGIGIGLEHDTDVFAPMLASKTRLPLHSITCDGWRWIVVNIRARGMFATSLATWNPIGTCACTSNYFPGFFAYILLNYDFAAGLEERIGIPIVGENDRHVVCGISRNAEILHPDPDIKSGLISDGAIVDIQKPVGLKLGLCKLSLKSARHFLLLPLLQFPNT